MTHVIIKFHPPSVAVEVWCVKKVFKKCLLKKQILNQLTVCWAIYSLESLIDDLKMERRTSVLFECWKAGPFSTCKVFVLVKLGRGISLTWRGTAFDFLGLTTATPGKPSKSTVIFVRSESVAYLFLYPYIFTSYNTQDKVCIWHVCLNEKHTSVESSCSYSQLQT